MAVRALVVVLFLIVYPRAAGACTCYFVPPCQGFWMAEAVFSGVVTSISHPSDDRPDQTHTEIALLVERGFKGEKDRIVLRGNARNEYNTCTFTFGVGRRYLVYAYRDKDGALTTNMCSGTKPLADAGDDLAYAERLPRAGSGGRIYGDVRRSKPDLLDHAKSRDEPAAGVKVTLLGSKGSRITLKTDKAGKFEAKRLEPDKYRISIDAPDSVRVYYDRSELDLHDRGCAPFSIAFEANGRIAGRLVDAAGRPVTSTRVWALPAKYTNKKDFGAASPPTATTDDAGHYELGPLPPDDYYVGANVEGTPTVESPYRPTYYPGVPNRADAQRIKLGEGELRRGVDFTVGPPLPSVAVSGTVVKADGTPARDVEVYLTAAKDFMMTSRGKTDESGAFTVTGLSGVEYILRASFYVSREDNGFAEMKIAPAEESVRGVRLELKKR